MEKIATENRVFSASFKKAKTCLMEMALAPSFFKLLGIFKPVIVSTDKGLQLCHSRMVGCHLLSWRNLRKKITFFQLFSKKPKHVSWKWL